MNPAYKKSIKKIIKTNALTNLANPLFNKRVPDCVYNYISINRGKPIWLFKNRLTNVSFCKTMPTIIVVLESPHIDEFDANGNPKAPLINDTRFRRFFFTKNTTFLSSRPNGIYQVILMNSIQLQCSLGRPTEYYRDYVFVYYWERLYRDFENRLRNYINSLDIIQIVNCCTKGSHKQCSTLYNNRTNLHEEMTKSFGKKFYKKMSLWLPYNGKCTLQGMVDYWIQQIIQQTMQNTGKSISTQTLSHPSSWP